MYINPIYKVGARGGVFPSQHPYAESNIGLPHVCSYHIDDFKSLEACVKLALSTELSPYIPPDFKKEAHLERVKKIFGL